jgi:hypothetical protein
MARRHGVFGNVLVILGMFVLAGALVILLPLLRRSDPILPPESPEIAAKRQAPENAYFVLKEAADLLPQLPPALPVPDEEVPKIMVKYKPAECSLGQILSIARPDDDPQLTAYLADCEKAIAKTRDSLMCPYYLLPANSEPRSINDVRGPFQKGLRGFHQLGAVLNARGLQSIRAGDCAGAWAWMRDAVRFALLMRNDWGDVYISDGSLGPVLDCLNMMLPACPVETLQQVEVDIKALDAELKPSIPTLEFYLRETDQYPLGYSPDAINGPARLLYAVNASLMRRSIRSWARRNLDDLFEAFQRPYPEANRWLEQAGEPRGKAGNAAGLLRRVRHLIVSDAQAEAGFRGATLIIALERYRRVHAAYPESLDALVPDELDSAVEDPFTGSAFVYRRVDKDYQLYSVGWNQGDDGGGTIPEGRSRPDGDDVVIHWPARGAS